MRSVSRISPRRVAMAILSLTIVACLNSTATVISTESNPATEVYASSLGINLAQMTKLSPDLYVLDTVVGTGAVLGATDSLAMTYTGWLVDGTMFESNVGAATPSTFRLGFGHVIGGLDQGLTGMKVGGTRRLVMGSALGYGAFGSPPVIPGASTLVFDVQLLARYP